MLPGCRPPRPFHRNTTTARELGDFPDLARDSDAYGSTPTVGSRPNLYQSYPPPSSGADPRPHLRAALQCASQEYCALPQKRGPQARPNRRTIAYDNALRETSIGTSNNTNCSATPYHP